MNFAETMLFYATIGLAVAAARWLNERPTTPFARLSLVPATTLFWPLYLPLILTKKGADDELPLPAPHDDLDRAIAQVDNELSAALADLDDGPETVMKAHAEQIRELRPALNAEAERIRRMDRDEVTAVGTSDAISNVRAGLGSNPFFSPDGHWVGFFATAGPVKVMGMAAEARHTPASTLRCRRRSPGVET